MFRSIFGKSRLKPPASGVTSIVVRQSAHDSSEQTDIVSDAVDFVNYMQQQGAYLRDELPPNSHLAYHTDYYLAQVANGGHGQFVGNSRWDPIVITDITRGLAAMNAEPYRSIFSDLCSLIESDKGRAERIAEGSGFGEIDPAIKALDDRFFEHDTYKTFSPMIARWLRGLPELEVVADADYTQRLQQLWDSNPQREARLAIRADEILNANLENPLWVAGRLLCFKAGCMPMQALGNGDPSTVTPDGEQITGWYLQTGSGRKVLQIGQETSYLCDTYLEDGTLVTNELMASIGQQISEGHYDDMARFATMTQREVARMPTSEMASAIAAAKETPVLLIARLLVDKLGTGERVVTVYAGAFHNSGQWLWFVESNERPMFFGMNDDWFVLSDLASQDKLASVSFDEVRAAQANQPHGHA